MNWRTYLLIGMLVLSIIDLGATFYYVKTYKNWQPDKPYNQIELNPLLVFLWNKIGLILGMLVGSVIILTLIYIVGKEAHWAIAVIIFVVLSLFIYNHYNHIGLLHRLMEMYPSGHLPVETFGEVVGNN